MVYQHYLTEESIKYGFDEIQKRYSPYAEVGNFWVDVLELYFPGVHYRTMCQGHPNGMSVLLNRKVERRAKWQTMIIMESKRKDLEYQDAKWEEALEELNMDIEALRDDPLQDHSQVIYGAINIGSRTCFYQANGNDDTWNYYPGTDGKIYHVADDEVEIHHILKGWFENIENRE